MVSVVGLAVYFKRTTFRDVMPISFIMLPGMRLTSTTSEERRRLLQNNTHAWEGDSMRRIFAGWHRLLVASVMLPILSNSSVRAEVKLVASFEDPAQLQQWDIRAQAQLTASWATEGRTCLYLRFAGGQGVRAGREH